MSADNAIFYREIDGWWYVMSSSRSAPRTDRDYKRDGDEYGSIGACLMAAHKMFEHASPPCGGVVYDPEPKPEPKPERIAACLEFCRGHSTENLRGGVLEITYDPLREAVKAIVDDVEGGGSWNGPARTIQLQNYRRLKELLGQ